MPRYKTLKTRLLNTTAKWLFNPDFDVSEIAHIIMCCAVRWEVHNIYSRIPGTNKTWDDLIQKALIFPYVENCYVFPYNLIWLVRTPTSTPISQRARGQYTSRKKSIKEMCASKVPNLNINDLFLSYDKLRQYSLYNIGICYETLFASSLAVKYYLRSLEQDTKKVDFLDIYDLGCDEQAAFEGLEVDFSKGIRLPDREIFVTSPSVLNAKAVIDNKKAGTAHHDIILPTKRSNASMNIAVQCKASFKLATEKAIQAQMKSSNVDGAPPVELLIWLYLGNEKREESYQTENVAFMNGAGCCSGLALDMLILTKRLISKNNKY